MYRSIAVVISLSASVALACAGLPLCIPLAPGDRLNVPANAPAFVAARGFSEDSKLTLRVDGGVRELELLDGGSGSYELGFYAPGPIVRGQQLVLESNVSTCGLSTLPRSEVSVIDAAPFPTSLGEVVLGDATGYVRPEGANADCSPTSEFSAAKRTVSLLFPDDVTPWLALMRVRVNDARPTFGHLARSVNPGTPTLVGEISFDCNESRQKVTRELKLELEIPGRTELISATSMVEIDCSVAPPKPLPKTGCSSAPVLSLGALVLWLTRRGRRRGVRLRQRREDETIE